MDNKISKLIRNRRTELGLTLEEAAAKAGVGTKTWWRYEAGEAIRNDKIKGICKALNWRTLPEDSTEEASFNLEEYKQHDAWSEYICKNYGTAAAVSFAIGCDILQDSIEDDLQALASLPRGTHIGQLPNSMLAIDLPEQFLMRYDYEFLYCLKSTVEIMKESAHNNVPIVAHSVLQELALYLTVTASELLMDAWSDEMEASGIEDVEYWRDWVFEVFEDDDIVTFLYSDFYVPDGMTYHFDNWTVDKFFTPSDDGKEQ